MAEMKPDGRFWPQQAYRTILAPMGKWLLSDDREASDEVLRRALDRYWTGRITAVREPWLSDGARGGLARIRSSINSQTSIGGGYELVERGIVEPDSMWFFELGSVAWMMRLRELRTSSMLPETAGAKVVERIEKLWAASGTEAVSAGISKATKGDPTADAALALYRLPIAIWNDRDMGLAVRILDHLSQRIPRDTISAMGATWPLTFALVHALRGDTAMAARLLDPAKLSSRPLGWTGLDSVEARYQRARYMWDRAPGATLEADDEASTQILEQVILDDPAYLLRVLTDKGWRDTNPQGQRRLDGVLEKILRENTASWTRRQQSRSTDESLKALHDIVGFLGADGYVITAAQKAAATAEAAQGTRSLDATFMSSADRLNRFMGAMPSGLRIRMRAGGSEVFTGAESVASQFADACKNQDATRARALSEALFEELPNMLRIGLAEYGMNLSHSIQEAGRVVEDEASKNPAERDRLKFLVDLLNDCGAQSEAVRDLGKSVGNELERQVGPIWAAFEGIMDRWGKRTSRDFGRLRLAAAGIQGGEVYPIPPGGFVAMRLKAVDASGASVSGVPILWEVIAGPALERSDERLIARRIAVSLISGVTVLAIDAGQGRAGETGRVSAQVLGQPGSQLILPYRIG